MLKLFRQCLILAGILIISACSSLGIEPAITSTPVSLPDISGPEQFPKRAVIITLTPDTRSCSTLSSSLGRYYVKPGDSIETIAARFNKTVEELQRDNCLSSWNIQPGQQLIVPYALDSQPIRNNTDEQFEPATQTPNLTPIAVCMPRSDWQGSYVVQAGDTIYSIAKMYNLSLSELMTANCSSLNIIIHPGDILLVPFRITATPDANN